MQDQRLTDSEKALVNRVTSPSSGRIGVPCRDFERILKDIPTKNISVRACLELSDFVSNQLGHWGSEFYFSLAEAPNTDAQTEMESWQAVSTSLLDSLKAQAPSASEQIEQKHNLIVLQHSLKRAAKYNESTLFRKVRATALSKMSFMLNSIGFNGLASRMYSSALYPEGTVGRGR